ncbi:hypothetical protein Nmel_006539 [Mimus melanotis]
MCGHHVCPKGLRKQIWLLCDLQATVPCRKLVRSGCAGAHTGLSLWDGVGPLTGSGSLLSSENKHGPVGAGAEHSSSAKASPGASQGQQGLLILSEKEHLDFPWHVGLCCCRLHTGIAVLGAEERWSVQSSSMPCCSRPLTPTDLLMGKNKEKGSGCKRVLTKVHVSL